ncbi:405_t:CDS:2 [Funneliformis geosporum]|nr:405_t:CDS:2 [Funneliformis geosporum]
MEKQGYIYIYYGDGKGKTSHLNGMTIRALEMNDQEKSNLQKEINEGIAKFQEITQKDDVDLIVVDEILGCIHNKQLSEEVLINILKNKKPHIAIALSGHNLSDKLKEVADLVSQNFQFSADPTSYHYEGQEYLVLFLCSQNLGKIINNRAGGKNKTLFATPFTNLKFIPNFSEKVDKDYGGDALLIKDPNQVEKLIETRNIKSSSPYQITFKVINQHKEGYGEERSGRRLTYQESFSKHGMYTHILEIEPYDLGIENLSPITHLTFSFATKTNPSAAGNYELTKSELYKSPLLENSAGKTFTMKVKEFKIHGRSNNLHFGSNYDYVFGSLTEKNEVPAPKTPKNDKTNSSPKPLET